MVVNKKGGNKTKKQKKVTDSESSRPLVLKDIEQMQEYAQIVKPFGNGRFEANCFDGKIRLAHARGNLKKKKIFVKTGNVVLLSLREFEDNKCDILDVYNQKEIKELKKLGEIPKNIIEDITVAEEKDDGIDFVDEDDDEEEDENAVLKEQFKKDFEDNFDAI